MVKIALRAMAPLSLLLLAACSGDGPGAGGMTAGEIEKLDSAAEQLDQRAPSPAQPMAAQLESEVSDGIAAEHNAQ